MKFSGDFLPILVFLSVILTAAAAESWSYSDKQKDPKQWMVEKCDRDCLQYHERLQEHGICRRRCLRRMTGEREGGRREAEEEEEALMELQRCQQKCRREQSYDLAEKIQCEVRCAEEYKWRGGEGGLSSNKRGEVGEKQGFDFVFDKEDFNHRVDSRYGSITVLERFDVLSHLLQGIMDYRLAEIVVAPTTFVMPNYWDADALLYVRRGMGNINMITSDHDKQESHGLRKGDVIRVPAGTMVYIVNNNSEILTIVALLKTTSPPGQFKEYYGAGGAVPPSFYRTFSNDLLEAAFNTDREKIEKLFEKQKEGPFLKATSKQLSGIGREGSTSTHWPFGSGSVDSPFNLHEKSPASFNGYGQLREVDRNEYRQLKDLDVMVSFLNLTMGSMMAPFYNTKSTTISLVTRGRGYIELACPHHPTGQGENDDNTLGDYRKVEADLHPGMVFVTMTGHPIIIVANEGKNLEVLTFVISPEMNKMNFLAGKNNLLNQLDDSAKILSFHQSADEVNHVLNSQDLEVFFPGPELRKQSGKHDGRKQRPIATILDLVGF